MLVLTYLCATLFCPILTLHRHCEHSPSHVSRYTASVYLAFRRIFTPTCAMVQRCCAATILVSHADMQTVFAPLPLPLVPCITLRCHTTWYGMHRPVPHSLTLCMRRDCSGVILELVIAGNRVGR